MRRFLLMRRFLGFLATIALAACAPAAGQETQRIDGEIVRVLRQAHERAPYRTWDDLHAGMPDTVQWHAAPSGRRDAKPIRRTGWLAAAGRQAGVAACVPALGPELVTLRTAIESPDPTADPVLNLLRAQGVELQRIGAANPDSALYAENGQWDNIWFSRETRCTHQSTAAARRCSVSYIVDVRPNYASAPTVQECRAP